MTQREKTLGAIIGLLAVAFIGYWSVKQYRQYIAELAARADRKRAEIAAIRKEIKEYEARRTAWEHFGAQTLSTDPVRLQNLLRVELDQLAKNCGLNSATVTLGKLTELGRRARGQTDMVRVHSATVSAVGRVENVMEFLYRLYSQPYLVRVRSLSLLRPARGAEKGVVTMNATVDTPILPPTKARIAIEPANLEPHERREVARLAEKDFAAYRKGIVRKKLFEPYEKIVAKAANPNPAVGAVLYDATEVTLTWIPYRGSAEQRVYFGERLIPSDAEPVAELRDQSSFKPDVKLETGKNYVWRVDTIFEEELTRGDEWRFRVEKKPEAGPGPPPPPPPPPAPPADAEFYVGRVLSSPLAQQVVLEDRRTSAPPNLPVDKRVELGEPLYDGTLVYVHPKGPVSEKDGALRLHPIGEQVRNLVVLSADDKRYPDVYHEVMKLRAGLEGITQGPEAGPGTGG
ncbi:MAG: hypothetical protein AMXMBFR83_18570 [Phycisphaerae bacterium]